MAVIGDALLGGTVGPRRGCCLWVLGRAAMVGEVRTQLRTDGEGSVGRRPPPCELPVCEHWPGLSAEPSQESDGGVPQGAKALGVKAVRECGVE